MKNMLCGMVAAYGFVETKLWSRFAKHRARREQKQLERRLKLTTLYKKTVSRIDDLCTARNTVSAAVISFLREEQNDMSSTLELLNYQDVLDHFYDIYY